jgi:hypothetical protein
LLALVGVGGAVVGGAVTGAFNYVSHKGDVDAKMIELSVGILRAPVTDQTMPLREWAIGTLQDRAKFTFSEAERDVLLKGELPFKGGDTDLGSYGAYYRHWEGPPEQRAPNSPPPQASPPPKQ